MATSAAGEEAPDRPLNGLWTALMQVANRKDSDWIPWTPSVRISCASSFGGGANRWLTADATGPVPPESLRAESELRDDGQYWVRRGAWRRWEVETRERLRSEERQQEWAKWERRRDAYRASSTGVEPPEFAGRLRWKDLYAECRAMVGSEIADDDWVYFDAVRLPPPPPPPTSITQEEDGARTGSESERSDAGPAPLPREQMIAWTFYSPAEQDARCGSDTSMRRLYEDESQRSNFLQHLLFELVVCSPFRPTEPGAAATGEIVGAAPPQQSRLAHGSAAK